jgi:hypothetical protein
MPKGWPTAIAPPLTFSFSSGMPGPGGGDHLGGERLVDLEEVDVVDGQAGAAQGLLRRLDRAEAHDLGRQAGDAGRDDAGERGEAELACLGVAHDHHRGGAVVERAAVAGGDQAVGAEDRLEARDALHRDAGARAVVLADDGAVRQW